MNLLEIYLSVLLTIVPTHTFSIEGIAKSLATIDPKDRSYHLALLRSSDYQLDSDDIPIPCNEKLLDSLNSIKEYKGTYLKVKEIL